MIVRALSGKSVIVRALTLAFASAHTEVGQRCEAIFYCRVLPCTLRNAIRHYTLSHARGGEHAADHLRRSAAQGCGRRCEAKAEAAITPPFTRSGEAAIAHTLDNIQVQESAFRDARRRCEAACTLPNAGRRTAQN